MLMIKKIKGSVQRNPDGFAIISEGNKLTYKELWERATSLAIHMKNLSGSDKTPIVVYGHKEVDMLTAFLGCSLIGAAYCPVDISMPVDRIKEIVSMVGNDTAIVLREEILQSEENPFTDIKNLIDKNKIDALSEIATENEHLIEKFEDCENPEDIDYIIFTSGSTGKPKGVQITHENLSNFTDWSVELTGADKGIFLNQAPFSFDLSVMDVYTALTTGSTIFCITKSLLRDMRAMFEELRKSRIEYWVSTPSFADMCMAERAFNAEMLPELHQFLFCGERLTKTTAKQLFERFPKADIINMYGPTESTVAVSAAKVTREMLDAEDELPIGDPKNGTEFSIDKETEELIISGDTVAKGYFNNDDKTQEAFFINKKGERAYRTGDAVYMKNGTFYIKGRMDSQVKLHGYRMELGDIEANLEKIKGIDSACVIPKEADGKVKYLVGFVRKKVDAEDASDKREMTKRIKTELKTLIPEYMVPKRIRFIENMPITSNGKTDRKKLKELV